MPSVPHRPNSKKAGDQRNTRQQSQTSERAASGIRNGYSWRPFLLLLAGPD